MRYYPRTSKEVGQINLSVSDKSSDKSLSIKKKRRFWIVGTYEKIQLTTLRYKGFRYVEKLDDLIAVVSNDKRNLMITGNFSNLKLGKEYLIADIVENRVEVL